MCCSAGRIELRQPEMDQPGVGQQKIYMNDPCTTLCFFFYTTMNPTGTRKESFVVSELMKNLLSEIPNTLECRGPNPQLVDSNPGSSPQHIIAHTERITNEHRSTMETVSCILA